MATIINQFLGLFKAKQQAPEMLPRAKAPKAYGGGYYDGVITLNEQVLIYNGEKTLGEMGRPIHYVPDYYTLATRSWQAYLDSPLAGSIVDKFMNWIIGEGLKLKANPSILVLQSEGVNMSKKQREQFNDMVEARFTVWGLSKTSSLTNEMNFIELTREVYLNSKISGDILVILKYIDGVLKVQMIDGANVINPSLSQYKDALINNGVQKDPKTGKVIGYHVRQGKFMDTEFIPAYSDTGIRTAFLVKGNRWRIGYDRGLPIIASVLSTLSKIDAYRDATLASAEEIAKIVYQVVHQNYSDGSNPDMQTMVSLVQNAMDANNTQTLPVDDAGNELANKVAVTTGKRAFNNPIGAKIETINKGQNVEGFDKFHEINTLVICACIGIPMNIAMSLYTDSFSASRAATKDWDHTMDVERFLTDSQFLSYVYKFWLFTEIAKNKITAPGYITAFFEGNTITKEAYEIARFTGPHFPHIDPDKEVKAQRRMLGPLADHLSLTTIQESMEELGTGDSDSVMEQFADEIKIGTELGLVPAEKPTNAGIKN
jgi:capsid protein